MGGLSELLYLGCAVDGLSELLYLECEVGVKWVVDQDYYICSVKCVCEVDGLSRLIYLVCEVDECVQHYVIYVMTLLGLFMIKLTKLLGSTSVDHLIKLN